MLKKYYPYIFLTVLIVFVYANSLKNDFVSDDVVSIVSSYPRSFLSVFSERYYFFRHIIYWITFQVDGINPIVFRLVNIFFHMGTACLAYAILSVLTIFPVAITAVTLFAVHPILTESVAWISGGVYPQYAFFFLVSFFLYIKSAQNKKLILWSYLAFLLCLVSSEKSVSLFLIFPLYDWAYVNSKPHWKKFIWYILLSAGFLAFYAAYIPYRNSFITTSVGQGGGFNNPFIQFPIALSTYLVLFFWPLNLSYYHGRLLYSYQEYFAAIAVCVLFLLSLLVCLKRNKKVFFWLLFFLISLLPTMTPLKLSSIIAERYAYLGILGLASASALILQKFVTMKKIRGVIYTLVFCIIILLSFRTFLRNNDWKNEENLWIATVKTAPDSANAHNNRGMVYLWHNDIPNAEQEFKTALSINPNLGEAVFHLGYVAQLAGKKENALSLYLRATTLNPTIWPAYQDIAVIYMENKRYDDALISVNRAISLNPRNADLYILLGIIQTGMNNRTGARTSFEKSLLIDPNNTRAKQALNELVNHK